jgi:thiamine-phosphate pyrophosphorylase
MNSFKNTGLYPILDLEFAEKHNLDIFHLVETWISYPDLVNEIQLRAKNLNEAEFRIFCKKIIFRFPDLKFIINDFWRVAAEFNTYGVHIGQEDFWEKMSQKEKDEFHSLSFIKGTSTHALRDVALLLSYPWSYAGFGPIFFTETKFSPYKAMGIKVFKEAVAISKIPLVPIGGLNRDNIMELILAGAKPASISLFSNLEEFKKIAENYPKNLA